MVKFAKYLKRHLVPEWRPAFCNYKVLKKELKHLKGCRSVDYRVHHGGYVALWGPSLQAIEAPSPADVILVHQKKADLYGSSLDLVETELLLPSDQAESEKPFFGRLDAELNKVNEFYKTKEKEFLQHADILDNQMQALFELKLASEQNFLRTRRLRYSSSGEDEDILTPLKKQTSIDLMDSVVSLHNEMLFQTLTNLNTMAENGLPSKDQLLSIRAQLLDMDSRASNINHGRRSPLRSISALSRTVSDDVSRGVEKIPVELMSSRSKEFTNFKAKVQHSEKMLGEAFVEFYRGLSLLKTYSSLNMLAFTKILKKYEKVTHRSASSTYLRTVDTSYFHTSTKVANLISWVEAMFTDYFAKGDRFKAKQALRPSEARSPHRITFFLGMFSGCSMMLAVAFVAVRQALLANMTDSERAARTVTYLKSVFPIFSMIALLLLHIYLYGWNLLLWRRTRINYAFIFEFPPGTELCYRKVLLMSTGLTVVLGVGMVGHLALHYSPSVLIDLIPLGVVLIILGLLFCPLHICFWSGRMFFLNCLFRIICAPFYEVLLADFFLGDQLCSQVPVLRNLQYLICYYGGGHFKTEDSDACLTNQQFMEISCIISVLPYWWRLMQAGMLVCDALFLNVRYGLLRFLSGSPSRTYAATYAVRLTVRLTNLCLRRYRDEKNGWHLANGGKYLSAMIVVLMKTRYGRSSSTGWMAIYVLASTSATFYQIYWDLVIDWGLLRRNTANPWLREQLILEDRNYIYFFSMGVNVILRFPWVLSITRFQFGGLDSHVIDFLLAAVEIVRRGLWNFFRLENEHLNNVGHYRAIKTVPLPFSQS